MNLFTATQPMRRNEIWGYIFGALTVTAAVAVCFWLGEIARRFPFIIFLPPVVLTAFLGGLRPGILAAVLSGAAADYLLIDPIGSFVPSSSAGWIALAFFAFAVSIDLAIIHGMTTAFVRADAAEQRLLILNGELEARVAERTGDLERQIADREVAEAQIRQMQKLEAVGQLTGGIAHDFNNMLAIVIGSIEMARRRKDDPEKLARSLEAAEEGANRAAQLTARLLAFSRQQSLAPQVIDANKLVAALSELLRRTLGEKVRIQTVLAGGLWRALVDAGQLENAVLNLAINARDAMPEGGRLTIETANAELDERYVRAHDSVEAGQYIMISVTDTGTGMSPQVVERAFDPFYTTKGIGKGTGLGLSQVFGFVKQSGGHAKIYSETDHGTTIKIYLPRQFGEDAIADLGAEPDILLLGDTSQIVLVVEDEDRVRHMSVDALRELGYTVIQATNANQALELLRVQPRIDLLFSDIVMPDMNGNELAARAMAIRPGLNVLYTSGYARNAVVHNGILDGTANLLTKPFTIAQLGFSVRQALGSDANTDPS